MIFKKRERDDPRLQIAPLVDILFLLIIFFELWIVVAIFGVVIAKPLVPISDLDDLQNHDKGSPMNIMLRTKLTREKNRVNDALREATAMLDAYLK